MRAFFTRAALVLALLQGSCLLSSAQMDQGDMIVNAVKESIQNGEDWHRALEAQEGPEAVASHKVEEPATKHLLRRLSARRSHEMRGALEARQLAMTTTATWGAGMANSQSKKYKQLKKQARGFSKSKATSESDKELTGTKQKNCAWQAFITGRMYNVAYPDTQAVYQVLVMMNVNENNIFRIRGKFPTKGVKYFSLQSNNPEVGFPVTTIKDYEIEPDPGSGRNPFKTDSDEPIGTYTLNVTPTGKQRDKDGNLLPNQLALCPEGFDARKCRSVNAVMLMRFYTSDPDRPAANSWTDPPASQKNDRIWGYEAPAVVETRSFNSWRVFPTCDQTRPTAITAMITDHFSQLIPPFADPIRQNKDDNFVMYLGEDTAKAGVYPNLDAAYLLAVGYDRGLPEGTHYIAKVTATLPTTPRNLVAEPKIANQMDYDVRYASFSSIGLVEGGPTADTLDDASFHRFYGKREGWNEDRKVSFVVAPNKDHTCGIYDPQNDLFLTTTIRGNAQDYWGILYRQLIPKFLHTGEPDKSNGYAHVACSAMPDNDACVDPAVLEQLQGDYYPHITFYKCTETGEIEAVNEKLKKIPIGGK